MAKKSSVFRQAVSGSFTLGDLSKEYDLTLRDEDSQTKVSDYLHSQGYKHFSKVFKKLENLH